MDKQVHKCPARVYSTSGYHSHQCSKTASHEHKGVMYCKTHHPPTVQAKREKKHAEWQAKWQGMLNAQKADADKRAEQKRRADCFPELLEALENIVKAADSGSAAIVDCLLLDARAAIAKATGEQA